MKPLDIVHVDASKIFIAWIVLGPVPFVQFMALSVGTIQRYLRLITSGDGPTKV